MKTRCPLPEVQDECDDGKVRRIVDIEEPLRESFSVTHPFPVVKKTDDQKKETLVGILAN